MKYIQDSDSHIPMNLENVIGIDIKGNDVIFIHANGITRWRYDNNQDAKDGHRWVLAHAGL